MINRCDSYKTPDLQKDAKSISIKEFHERVLGFLIQDFQKKGFAYVSTLPGGFQQCHDLSA